MTRISAQYGVQPEQLAKIPARIAVLPCRSWPEGARFIDQATIEIPPSDRQALCQAFDTYVLQGFEGQTYMRGLSPKVVKTLLEQNKEPNFLAQLDELWFRPGQACEACRHPASYYNEVIAPRIEWRTWLVNLSRLTSQADAVLLPLFVTAKQGEINDRGLLFNNRQAAIALLLIDTNNGQLIWMGGRQTESLAPKTSSTDTALPDPVTFFKNLFALDLWLEFPGRQIN